MLSPREELELERAGEPQKLMTHLVEDITKHFQFDDVDIDSWTFKLYSKGCVILFFAGSIVVITAELLLWGRFLNHPVEYKVVFVAHSIEEIFKELSQIANIRLFFELQTSTVV